MKEFTLGKPQGSKPHRSRETIFLYHKDGTPFDLESLSVPGGVLDLSALDNDQTLGWVDGPDLTVTPDGDLHIDNHFFSGTGVWSALDTAFAGAYAGFDISGSIYSIGSDGLGVTLSPHSGGGLDLTGGPFQVGDDNQGIQSKYGSGAFATMLSIYDADGGGPYGTWTNIGPGVIDASTDSLNDAILRLSQSSEAQYRYQQNADGAMHWGDGATALDTHLSRSDPNGDFGPGLNLTGDTSLFGQLMLHLGPDYIVYTDPDDPFGESGAVTLGPSGLNAFDGPSGGNAFVLRARSMGHSNNQIAIHRDGMIDWSDGDVAPDTHLKRSSEGVLGVFSEQAAYGGTMLYASNDPSLLHYTYELMAWDSGSDLLRHSFRVTKVIDDDPYTEDNTDFDLRHDGYFQSNRTPGGLIARSPDGTGYKLTPPNGGGAATWVAV